MLDPLPVPLTAYLGSGSDKLIGNAEADTCYPQGTRRNRCIGGPGDDICISAPVNTDCVGGAGDDYCRVRDGSDGCWGGPGRDVCVMGSGHDGCHGEGGADRLYGGPPAISSTAAVDLTTATAVLESATHTTARPGPGTKNPASARRCSLLNICTVS